MKTAKKIVKRVRQLENRRPNTVRKLNKKVNRLARRLSPEIKFYDLAISTNINYTGRSDNLLSSLGQGTTLNTRIGDTIKIKSIHVGLRMIADPAAVDPQDFFFRAWLVQGNNENAIPLDPPAFFTITSGGNIMSAPLNYLDRHRYTVLADSGIKRYVQGNQVLSATEQPPSGPTKLLLRLRAFTKKPATFVTATNNPENGSIYLIVATDNPTANLAMYAYSRIYFTDA